ncbi:aliphatic sulfonate ABC transporter substrate-binding protein [Quadrisphaera sp. DSM 44207]|uniref:aliphatic sulfonate ABC transporter substrate-binding protein n=1 Tax=Quadrisphaera sp. DSM 44207 TaxID=1881057 RepID=UPI000880DA3F|nr:aliphatic sulfonate ABC transporter substrate-binding protein [Quadrisphaera sp. DSM 44207]SDQ05980.1 sulfonate transport system substrate-binding protein [Quadrisphaera sp. DSM 44207]
MSLRTALTSSTALAALAASSLLLTGCAAGEDAAPAPAADGASSSGGGVDPACSTLTVDFATYNPLSLVVRDQGWLEAALAEDGGTVEWVQSAGSNKANEALRAGAIDVGSTAGSAALLARSNGSPIRTVDVFSQPEWSALVVRGDSDIDGVEDLRGRSVAATTGTDPYFFLLQALETAGLSPSDVTLQNLQHADGRTALDTGQVDAWAGLDPIMAAAEAESGDRLVYRNVDFNTYGFLNATEEFLSTCPEQAQTVVDAYEHARAWAQENPQETASVLAEVAGIDPAVATATLERTTLDVDPVPGEAQRAVLERVGPIFVTNGDVPSQEQIDEALDTLFETTYVEAADPEAFAAEHAGHSS